MVDGNAQAVLASGLLAVTHNTSQPLHIPTSRQPFCADFEGWGPLSSIRFDLTPCFLDIWVAITAVWGIVLGAGALWFLFTKRESQAVSKNWHFYAKLVSAHTRDIAYICNTRNKTDRVCV
jgi:hypothetical protein